MILMFRMIKNESVGRDVEDDKDDMNKHDTVAGGSVHTNTFAGTGYNLIFFFQWCFYTILICYPFLMLFRFLFF